MEKRDVIDLVLQKAKQERNYAIKVLQGKTASMAKATRAHGAAKMMYHYEGLTDYLMRDTELREDEVERLLQTTTLLCDITQYFTEHPEIALEPYRRFCLDHLKRQA